MGWALGSSSLASWMESPGSPPKAERSTSIPNSHRPIKSIHATRLRTWFIKASSSIECHRGGTRDEGFMPNSYDGRRHSCAGSSVYHNRTIVQEALHRVVRKGSAEAPQRFAVGADPDSHRHLEAVLDHSQRQRLDHCNRGHRQY